MYFPDLIEEYKQSLKKLKVAGGCSSMERDMLEAIKWMETGYDPAEYRAATRTDVYAMDHHLMQDLIEYVDSEYGEMEKLSDLKRKSLIKRGRIDENLVDETERMFKVKYTTKQAMAGLTDNERTAFIMIRAEHMTFSKVAKLFGVNRGTVQNYVKRAETKIANNISKEKLFSFAV